MSRVYRDAWGIPHLRAGDPYELAFAQGRVTALDRAWQIEVERRRATGTSAEILGPDAVPWDRFARQARLADTAERCLHALDGDTARWVGAYVDGVNAGLPEGARRAPEFAATEAAPREAAGPRTTGPATGPDAAGLGAAGFTATGHAATGHAATGPGARGLAPGRWEPWTPMAIWLSHHILFAHFPAKLWREAVAERLGPEAVALFAADGPGSGGSNGWLVPGDRTATGAALIAGDPHRFIEDPGFYQQIRLACPEFDVVGLAVPGVPGIAHFGHAGSVAWAITNAMADYQDLYRERLRRGDGRVEALGPDGWRPCEAHVEVVEVAGEAPVEVEVVETERGPVVMVDARVRGETGHGPVWEAVSLRYPPRVRRDLGFAALPALLRAKTVADVDRALGRWAEPVNVVLAADTGGGLLHRVAGVVPVRPPDNALRVVPAWEPGHEWADRHAPMPRRAIGGITVMANERGIAAPLGVEFAPPYRADRIRRLLDASPRWSAGDMAAVHTDTLLPSAGPLLDLLAGLDGLTPEAVRLRDRLSAWDRRMDAGSTDAAAYAAVRAEVVRRLATHPALTSLAGLDAAVPEVFRPWLALTPRVAYALESLLTTDLLPGLDRAALAEPVRAALEDVATRDEMTGLRWGDLHRLTPWRALPAPAIPGAAPVEAGLPGDHDCVLSTSSVPGVTHHCARGPAARYVWDLARRDGSLWIVPFGASGVPGDPHWRDQHPLWLRGELVPVITDWNRLTEERHDP
ncbi:penicillin acylase family protein [Microbispora sp. NEAU-D428]|uniref:penicillin acylase family protein n=1 Tax=Microbispora sitophila TaxID=2771537 RepID=UPI001865C3BB|nr:penicillin acylase family protein [Microbispora sitophila]MBE3010330.1 penicillin acylase family protein [Microbispora sitophila]